MKRPAAITVLCAILGALWLLNWISIGLSIGHFEVGRIAWIIGTQIVAGVSIAGIWMLKIWGPILYFLGQAVGIAAFFAMPPDGAEQYPVWVIFLVPAIVAIPIFLNWKAFSSEGGTSNA